MVMTDEPHAPGRHDAIPPALWVIARCALASFPLPAVAYGWGAADVARPALTVILTWSGVVLAFLGGVRWGMESGRPKPRAERLLISVLSPVAAWIILAARHRIPDGWIIGGCIGAFLVQWLFDQARTCRPATPTLDGAHRCACISLAVCLD